MLGLPQSTEVKRQVPKTVIYKKFDLSAPKKTAFDEDVSRIDIVNLLSPKTLPAITPGEEVKEIYIFDIQLKRADFRSANIELLAKIIPQKILFILHFEKKARLAIYQKTLFLGPWCDAGNIQIPFDKQNLDNIWNEFVSTVGDFSLDSGASLNESIDRHQDIEKLKRDLKALDKKLASTAQPHKRRDLFLKKLKLQEELKSITA
jgi:hypothetical protein